MIKQQCDSCPAKTFDRKQKRAVIEAMIRQHPQDSARLIARRLKWLSVDHKTVGKYRDRLVATGEIPQFKQLNGADGKRRRGKLNRPQNDEPIHTCYQSDNAELIAKVASLYLRAGDKVADVTFGGGRLWHKVNVSQFDFFPSDLVTCPDAPFDFTSLPYPDSSFDAVAFDPPYCTRGEQKQSDGPSYGDWLEGQYKLSSDYSYSDILELFTEGMAEGKRILKHGGLLLVKCADEARNGTQRMTHIEVHRMAADLDLLVKDLFILHRQTDPVVYGKQRHARKNHSYLWIFEKV